MYPTFQITHISRSYQQIGIKLNKSDLRVKIVQGLPENRWWVHLEILVNFNVKYKYICIFCSSSLGIRGLHQILAYLFIISGYQILAYLVQPFRRRYVTYKQKEKYKDRRNTPTVTNLFLVCSEIIIWKENACLIIIFS